MKTVAIIAEYNPYHNGHAYLIQEARRITECDYVVALMSGNFVQRGMPAAYDKYTRASMAVSDAVDLVLELPFVFATGSAKDFATGAISILEELHSVDYLCFGAECDNLERLSSIAKLLYNMPEELDRQIRVNLMKGDSYPVARANALLTYCEANDLSNSMNPQELAAILASPNNILAIEYLLALDSCGSSIQPLLIKRSDMGYHSTMKDQKNGLCSATALRHILQDETTREELHHYMPTDAAQTFLSKELPKTPVPYNALSPFLQQKLIQTESPTGIFDMTEELWNRLQHLSMPADIETICEQLKTKNITRTRISRTLLHYISNYTKEAQRLVFEEKPGRYANILAFKRESSTLLRFLSDQSQIPIITKKADFMSLLEQYPDIDSNIASMMWRYDLNATALYNCLLFNEFGYQNTNDYTTKLPIL